MKPKRPERTPGPYEKFADHPLLKDRYFYALPKPLWEALKASRLESRLNRDLFELEDTVSEACDGCAAMVGVWRNKAVEYRQFEPIIAIGRHAKPQGTPIATSRDMGNDDLALEGVDDQPRELDRRTERLLKSVRTMIADWAQGYSGWLLTNRVFLEEHDKFFAENAFALRHSSIRTFDAGKDLPLPRDPNETDLCFREMEELCERWALKGFAGPHLPVPITPDFSSSEPEKVRPFLERCGSSIYMPVTFRLLPPQELRDFLDLAIRPGPLGPHLSGWEKIVKSRKSMEREARLFRLQHYWRLMCERHPMVSRGGIDQAETVFGKFLRRSKASVHDDLREIRKRLGNSWHLRRSDPREMHGEEYVEGTADKTEA